MDLVTDKGTWESWEPPTLVGGLSQVPSSLPLRANPRSSDAVPIPQGRLWKLRGKSEGPHSLPKTKPSFLSGSPSPHPLSFSAVGGIMCKRHCEGKGPLSICPSAPLGWKLHKARGWPPRRGSAGPARSREVSPGALPCVFGGGVKE